MKPTPPAAAPGLASPPASRRAAAAEPDTERTVQAMLLEQAYERLPMSVLLTVAVALSFTGLLLPFFERRRLLAWLALLLTVSAARYALGLAWRRARPGLAEVERWRGRLLAGAGAAGMAWSLGAVLLMPAAGRVESLLLVLALLGVSAVAVATLSPQRAAANAFLAAALTPMVAALAVGGGRVEQVAALALAAVLGALLLVVRASQAGARAQALGNLQLAAALAEAHHHAAERDRQARAHAAERERLASIIDCTDAGTGEWHVDTGAIVFSERWAQMLGYTLRELEPITNTTWLGLCHPADVPGVQALLKRHFAGEVARCDCELRMRHKAGHWVWTQIRGRLAQRAADGRPLLMTGLHMDVSERKLSEQRWQARAELSADGFWESDAAHRIVLWHEGVLNRLPVQEAALLGRSLEDIEALEPGPGVLPVLRGCLRERLPFRGMLFRFDGGAEGERWLEADGRPRYAPDGSFAGYEGVARDVTERHLATASLQESLALVDKLFETIPIPVLLKDPTGRYSRVNRAYADKFGPANEPLVGGRVSSVVEAEAAEVHERVDRELFAEAGERRYEVTQRLTDGRCVDVIVCKATLVRPDGSIGGLVGAVVDITEQKQAARALQQAMDEAEAANRAKSSFLATMSHELRTPLNAVIGAAQLLRAEGVDPAQQAHLVDAIQRSGTNLLGLIENILDLSRIEAGRFPLHPVDFNLLECVDAALATASLAARAKGLRMTCIVAPDLAACRHGDATRLRQVMLNLLGNAVKFTDRGEVVLRVQPGVGEHDVRVAVRDTGVGIAAASLAHVFEPFRQAEDKANRRFGGSGLGLAIVSQLVKAMGGRIGATSTPGEGSCFEFELPLAPAHAPPPALPPLDTPVLWCEPHEASAEALAGLLLRLGCEGRRCEDARDLHQALVESDVARPPWLLLAADCADWIEPAAALVDPARLVVVVDDSAPESDQAREAQQLLPQLIRPVTEAALRARLDPPRKAASRGPHGPRGVLTRRELAAMTHVLVVEDDELNRTIVSGMLQHAGHRVSLAAYGRQALQLLPQLDRVDLVLMDWQMPDLDGLEVTRRLRAGEGGPAGLTVPIVALTANAFAEDRAACIAAGMNDFLTKPVLASRLLETVRHWTQQPAAPAAAPAPAQASRRHSVFDPGVLQALPMVADGSSPDYESRLLDLFVTTSRQALTAIEEAAAGRQDKELMRLVHTLKSGSASVGAVELASLAAAQETRLRKGLPPEATLMNQLTEAFERLVKVLGGRAVGEGRQAAGEAVE